MILHRKTPNNPVAEASRSTSCSHRSQRDKPSKKLDVLLWDLIARELIAQSQPGYLKEPEFFIFPGKLSALREMGVAD
jgi:hypothetical protein